MIATHKTKAYDATHDINGLKGQQGSVLKEISVFGSRLRLEETKALQYGYDRSFSYKERLRDQKQMLQPGREPAEPVTFLAKMDVESLSRGQMLEKDMKTIVLDRCMEQVIKSFNRSPIAGNKIDTNIGPISSSYACASSATDTFSGVGSGVFSVLADSLQNRLSEYIQNALQSKAAVLLEADDMAGGAGLGSAANPTARCTEVQLVHIHRCQLSNSLIVQHMRQAMRFCTLHASGITVFCNAYASNETNSVTCTYTAAPINTTTAIVTTTTTTTTDTTTTTTNPITSATAAASIIGHIYSSLLENSLWSIWAGTFTIYVLVLSVMRCYTALSDSTHSLYACIGRLLYTISCFIAKSKIVLLHYVLLMSMRQCAALTTDVDLSTLSGPVGFTIRGGAASDFTGRSVSAAGDVNGDGIDDVIVGAIQADPTVSSTTRTDAGISYVLFGRSQVDNPAAYYASINLMSLNTAGSALGFAIIGAVTSDYSGYSVAAAGDVNGDGIGDVIVGAYYADPVVGGTTRYDAGISYVIFGRRKSTNEADSYVNIDLLPLKSAGSSLGFAILGAATSDNSGISVSAAGDVNGDGIGDVIVGAWHADPIISSTVRTGAGISYVIFGRSKAVNLTASYANIDLLPLDTAGSSLGFAILGAASDDCTGRSVSAAGDVNGDGIGDVIMGAYTADPVMGTTRMEAGISYVIFGRNKTVDLVASYTRIDLLPLNTAGSSFGFAIVGAVGGDKNGGSVSAAGDVNGDGIGDVIVGAVEASPFVNSISRTMAGMSYIIFGRRKSTNEADSYVNIDLLPLNSAGSPLGFAIWGAATSDNSGSSVSAAGDVNGDGLSDLIVGAYFASPVVGGATRNGAGVSYVIFGRRSTVYANIDLATFTNAGTGFGFRIVGAAANDQSGTSVSKAGDVNKDGIGDIIVGALGVNSNAGASYVIFGSLPTPTSQPSSQPSGQPSRQPSGQPSRQPSTQPSSQPSAQPVLAPTAQPSRQPSGHPSRQPSTQPTATPTVIPSAEPSSWPTTQPSEQPTKQPTRQPSAAPSSQPSGQPSARPTRQPSAQPSAQPTTNPSSAPSCQPSTQPSTAPSAQPSADPTQQPSARPSSLPTSQPSSQPNGVPSMQPTSIPSAQPSDQPSSRPSMQPTSEPSAQPSVRPSVSPSGCPSAHPSTFPTAQPSTQPSVAPSSEPSAQPSASPSCMPSVQPTTQPSTAPSSIPSSLPSSQPSALPSSRPSSQPTTTPSSAPSAQPTGLPSMQPTSQPTAQPSTTPSTVPSVLPTVHVLQNEWLVPVAAATRTVLFNDQIFSCGRQTCSLVDAASDVVAQYTLPWDETVSMIGVGASGGVILHGRTRNTASKASAIANCAVNVGQLSCAVKSIPDAVFYAGANVPLAVKTVFVGAYNVRPTILIVDAATTSMVLNTYSAANMKSLLLTHVASPPYFVGAFVAGTSVRATGTGAVGIVLGMVRTDQGMLSAMSVTPVNGAIVNSDDLVTGSTLENTLPDSFIVGGLELSEGIGGKHAYLMRANGLFKSIKYVIRYRIYTGGGGRRALSSAVNVSSVARGVVLVGTVLYTVLDVRSAGTNISALTVLKVLADTGAVVQQVHITAANSSLGCTDLSTTNTALIFACTVTSTTGPLSSVLISTGMDLAFSSLPLGWTRADEDKFSEEAVPFQRTVLTVTKQTAVFAVSESVYNSGEQAPSRKPSAVPTLRPSSQPSSAPSAQPSSSPTTTPTLSARPTSQPSSATPTNTHKPTAAPTAAPSLTPSAAPSLKPTARPSLRPVAVPTTNPTPHPTVQPSAVPTTLPTKTPSLKPTAAPKCAPSLRPTRAPTSTSSAEEVEQPEVSDSRNRGASPLVLGSVLGPRGFVVLCFVLYKCRVHVMENYEKDQRRVVYFKEQEALVRAIELEREMLIMEELAKLREREEKKALQAQRAATKHKPRSRKPRGAYAVSPRGQGHDAPSDSSSSVVLSSLHSSEVSFEEYYSKDDASYSESEIGGEFDGDCDNDEYESGASEADGGSADRDGSSGSGDMDDSCASAGDCGARGHSGERTPLTEQSGSVQMHSNSLSGSWQSAMEEGSNILDVIYVSESSSGREYDDIVDEGNASEYAGSVCFDEAEEFDGTEYSSSN